MKNFENDCYLRLKKNCERTLKWAFYPPKLVFKKKVPHHKLLKKNQIKLFGSLTWKQIGVWKKDIRGELITGEKKIEYEITESSIRAIKLSNVNKRKILNLQRTYKIKSLKMKRMSIQNTS